MVIVVAEVIAMVVMVVITVEVIVIIAMVIITIRVIVISMVRTPLLLILMATTAITQ
jgi:hypothetical protein